MTDRQLLELAAKAAGLQEAKQRIEFNQWNPLEDDGDAMRLAIRLRIVPACDDDTASVYCNELGGYWCINNKVLVNGDPYAATRRAITRAAAEIGRAMP